MIPYNQKIDISLLSVQKMVSAFNELLEAYEPDKDYGDNDKVTMTAILVAQKYVNKTILDLLEAILEPNYPGASRYRPK